MPLNPDWERWCIASAASFFKAALSGVAFLVEGEDNSNIADDATHVEFRMIGPNAREQSKGQWKLTFEINIVATAVRDGKDIYQLKRLTGRVAAAFTTIPVLKYGDGDGALGCLTQFRDLRVVQLGQPALKANLDQAIVEGFYEIELSE